MRTLRMVLVATLVIVYVAALVGSVALFVLMWWAAALGWTSQAIAAGWVTCVTLAVLGLWIGDDL